VESIEHLYESVVGVLYSWLVEPALFQLGWMGIAEDAFDGTAFLLGGLLQVPCLWFFIRPLELWRPVQTISDPQAVKTDRFYTLINQLGVLPLASFFLLWWLFRPLESALRLQGFISGNLESWLAFLPQQPVLTLLLYIVVTDFAEYWRHRWQHAFKWWWALHALHHAQRDMTLWSDSRNHVLDEIIAAFWMAAIALLIGVPPAQFPLVLFAGKFVEALSHANFKSDLGWLGKVIVSPQFHRVHHGITVGHTGLRFGANFSVLFSVWDPLFRTTASTQTEPYPTTGIDDQLLGRDYGQTWWQQQRLGLQRLLNQHA
jgi:sterol desaturase/sphingolipid hydroxylase (fatty acid hydroxylase superfamily)